MKLVIYIPTYERASLVLRQIETLSLYRGPDEIVVVVRDNHSAQPEYAQVREACRTAGFTYVRNVCNIGGNPNILDGFMYCGQGDHLWVLSDDDILRESGLDKVLALLHTHAACDILYLMDNPTPEVEDALDQPQLYAIQDFGLGLISRVIYRSEFVRPHLRAGYDSLLSCYPHLAVLYEAAKQNGVTRVCQAHCRDVFVEGDVPPAEPDCYVLSRYGYTLLARNLEERLRRKFLIHWWQREWHKVCVDRNPTAYVQKAACFALLGRYLPLFHLRVRLWQVVWPLTVAMLRLGSRLKRLH